MEQTAAVSRSALWTGRILGGVAVLFMVFDSTIHLMVIEPVVQSFGELGYPVELSVTLGIIELLCLVLYLIPRTSLLGAILLTGYLGGAVATQLRIGAPLASTVLFPIYVGTLAWGWIFLRDTRMRNLFREKWR
jgi:DoxX-like family